MLQKKSSLKRIFTGFLVLFLAVPISVFSQSISYQAVRLNDGNPIIEPSMFNNPADGDNINGPSLIRVPDWIPVNQRPDASAQYYLYFADHVGDYIRMAWAASIDGPYTLYDDFTSAGDRGVLDNAGTDIVLGNGIRIEENHLASPDVIVDDENQRIIMYFHSGSSFFVDGVEQNRQVSWVSTSPYGLEFYNGIESVHFGASYFKVFAHQGDLYALSNSATINRALDGANPWAIPAGHDFSSALWETNPSGNLFQDDIPVPRAELRVRHTGVYVDGDQLHVFYSRRGEYQERIQYSTLDLTPDWTAWDPTYPPAELLAPNPGWEGGQRILENSETSAGVDVNQLRDPDVFEDNDGLLYIVYTGNGEGGLGIARLYETPVTDVSLQATEDAHIKQSSNSNFGGLSKARVSTGSSSSDQRTIYMKFDLSSINSLDHAVVRLYAQSTTGGPVTVYETSSSWSENSITRNNAPSLGDPIATVHLTDGGQFYDWNISDYAQQNAGGELSLAFEIAAPNDASHEFTSIQGGTPGSPGELLISTQANTCGVLIDENNFDASFGIWNDGGSDARRNSADAQFSNGGTGASVRLRDNTNTSVITTDSIDLSGFSEITVDFNFLSVSMEPGEDFWLQTSTDGGSSYQTQSDWVVGSDFENGVRVFESTTLQGPFPNDTRLRFRMDATANADLVYIDDVKIIGCN